MTIHDFNSKIENNATQEIVNEQNQNHHDRTDLFLSTLNDFIFTHFNTNICNSFDFVGRHGCCVSFFCVRGFS